MLRRSLLLSSLAPACALVSCARRAGAERTKLRVALSPLLTMSPFYTGYEAGYFRDAGFDLQLTSELPGVQSISLLSAGKVEVSFGGLSTGLMNAVGRGARIRIVAGREISSPACNLHGRIYVRTKDFPNGIQDMRPLRQRKIAVSSGTVTTLFSLDKLLEKSGMSRADVQVLPMQPSERLAALRAGGVSAFLSSATDLNPMLRDLQIAPGPSIADVLPNYQYSFILFGARLLSGDVRTGAAFLRAYFRGARDYLAGKTPAFMDEFAKSNGLDPKLVRAGCRDSFEHDGRIHLNDMQLVLDWAASQGYIPHPMSAQSLVDTRFLDALQRRP
jgi:NitT/TauT family transport system substrate-binding protein